ncbi:MAG: site-2 protease family protein [Oscillospiraceae bacterium]|nr:site-2 protease family protein [Oscillospiraceae bacterium]
MLFQLIGGRLDFLTAVIQILAYLVIIFLILPFHEWAHAFVAKCLGDTGMKYRGRLTLNPLEHIDPIGALCMILFGFGWAKPVPIDDRNFKNPKVGMGLSALAGPVANLLAALVGGLLYNLVLIISPNFLPDYYMVVSVVLSFLMFYTYANVTLAVFNLLPIPPLDGSKILFMFLPDKIVYKIYQYERFFFIAVIILIWFLPIGFISNVVTDFIMDIASLPFIPFR